MEINIIYNQDAGKGLLSLPDNSIDMVLTSPPYDHLRKYSGTEWNQYTFKRIARGIVRVMKPGAVLVLNNWDEKVNGKRSGTALKQPLYFSEELGMSIHDYMIYHKRGIAHPSQKTGNAYSPSFEFVWILSKGKPKTAELICDKVNAYAGATRNKGVITRGKDGKKKRASKPPKKIAQYSPRETIWTVNNQGNLGQQEKEAYNHPATMPETLARDHIRTWSKDGDIVLDPFMGSGTTALMALMMRRNYVGFEVSREYCQLADKRLEEERAKLI